VQAHPNAQRSSSDDDQGKSDRCAGADANHKRGRPTVDRLRDTEYLVIDGPRVREPSAKRVPGIDAPLTLPSPVADAGRPES
jgi:hypothetical protein